MSHNLKIPANLMDNNNSKRETGSNPSTSNNFKANNNKIVVVGDNAIVKVVSNEKPDGIYVDRAVRKDITSGEDGSYEMPIPDLRKISVKDTVSAGRALASRDNNAPTLEGKIEAFCRATRRLEQIRLAKTIHAELNNLSVELFTDCKISPAEYKLRGFLLQDDTLNVINGIDIYASILSVMLKHGLQPQLRDKDAFADLLSHLEMVVEPPKFFPMSLVRRDIEAVIKMLKVLTNIRREVKINNAIELIGELKDGKNQVTIIECLKKYLKYNSWIQHYLVLSWLKMQTLVLKKPDALSVLLQVVSYLLKSPKKANSTYPWKFTITVVDILVQIAREVSVSEMPNRAIKGLLELFNEIEKRKLHDCINIFHQHARILVFIDNVGIRSLLMDGIYKELDTTAEEICKERIKHCTDLELNATRELVHNGSYSCIFFADCDSLQVVVKCYKQTQKELIEKHTDPHPKYFDFECRFLNNLSHPNIIKLIKKNERVKCVVLEFVPKGNLLTVLRNRRSDTLAPTLTELLFMAVQIAGAVKYLEEKNIIHLAMQLRNVLLHENNVVKLTGFQFCRTLQDIENYGVENAIEQKHFKWLDPQALLFKSIDLKTVSWSLGVLLYELLTLGCVPFNHPEPRPNHGDFKRGALTSPEARIFIIRGGKLRKESCIPDNIFTIISNCLEKEYSSRATLNEITNQLKKELDDQKTSEKIYPPPPRLVRLEEDEDLESHNPGTDDYDDNFPFAHLDVLDHPWNKKYQGQVFEEAYSNANPSRFMPLLCIIQRRKEGVEWKETRVLEYVEFKAIKHVETLQKLSHPQLLNVIAVNRFGPDRLEMISESFPMGNIRDALLQHVELRNNLKLYIRQAASALFYLHEERIVHRKIRIENYLIDNEGRIKLGCLGTSIEEIDVNAEYCDPRAMNNLKILPDVLRDAPEVLVYHLYTRKSDTWAFGVVVWQFLKIATTEPVIALNDIRPHGMKLESEASRVLLPNPYPQSCPLYELCEKCWEWDAKDRPSMFVVIEAVDKSDLLELRQFSDDVTDSTELHDSGPSNEDHLYFSIKDIKREIENEDAEDTRNSGNMTQSVLLESYHTSDLDANATASTQIYNPHLSNENLSANYHIYSSIEEIKKEDGEAVKRNEPSDEVSLHETACNPLSGNKTEEDGSGIYDDVVITPVEIVHEDIAMNIGKQGHVDNLVKYFTLKM
ncbi:dual specificity protein kinase zakA-like [Dendronephthya gigantea]|uniref:dual specificity protein kinase zakA-like n=1 Tax=Dendronephthya gigantea TaxID=151771 RepID=UPI00106A9D80|nr:dual specificity protein kinase zakA-like [Dendronephthya gigantea]